MSARKSQVCTDKNIACYLSKTAITSHNRTRQAKTRIAQKIRCLQYKVRRKAGYLQAFAGKVHPLQMPAFSLTLYSTCPTLYGTCLTFGHTKISYFLAFLTKLELI